MITNEGMHQWTNIRMQWQTRGQTSGETSGWTVGPTGRRMDLRTAEQIYRRTDGHADGLSDQRSKKKTHRRTLILKMTSKHCHFNFCINTSGKWKFEQNSKIYWFSHVLSWIPMSARSAVVLNEITCVHTIMSSTSSVLSTSRILGLWQYIKK